MGRKNEGILELLTVLPWWISVIFSGIVYMTLKWLLPAIQIENIFLKSFARTSPNLAEPLAMFFLIPAPPLSLELLA